MDEDDFDLEWTPLDGQWKEFHEDWWGTAEAAAGPWSIRQEAVCAALGMPNCEQVVFDEELYTRVKAATRLNTGLVLDKGAGIDASTLRGFFLHHLTRGKPCYFTSKSAMSYMVDASGISAFPTDTFQSYHRYLPVLDYKKRPWSFFDVLPGKVKLNGYGDALHERMAPPYLVHPSGQTFSLLLADPTKASPQYDHWRRKWAAPRWSTPADTLMYGKYFEKSLG